METSPLRLFRRIILRVPPLLMLTLALGLTIVAALFADQKARTEEHARTDMLARRISQAIEGRMQIYVNSMLHTRSFLNARHAPFSLSAYTEFIEGLDLPLKYPGVRAIGYAPRIPAKQLASFTAETRRQGLKYFEVWPDPKGEDSYPVIALAPLSMSQHRALGFNLIEDLVRREAIDSAIASGLPTVSRVFTLLPSADGVAYRGFFLCVPIFSTDAPLSTDQQRRMAVTGVLYAPARSADLFNEILKEQDAHDQKVSIRVYDGNEEDPSQLIYPIANGTDEVKESKSSSQVVPIMVANRRWSVRVTPLNPPFPFLGNSSVWTILVFGSLTSALIYLFSSLVMRANAALARREKEIKLIANSLPVLIASADRELRFRFCNEAFREWFDLDPEQLIGRSMMDAFGAELTESYRPFITRALTGETLTFDREVAHRSLGARKVQITYIPERERNGPVQGFVVLMSDITDRLQVQDRLQEEQRVSELVAEVGLSLRGELELDRLVQKITDAATELLHAKYGAFFYNVTDAKGDRYTLFSISGAASDAFSKLPMPRKTELFGPTFNGERILRFDDITQSPAYGKNAPHQGLPPGHPDVKSYLAAPVVSRSGEVLGGLFFGHPRPRVFTERSEKLIGGIAAQAAVAIDNAKLYSESQAINRIKDEFLATLSHELRTPLNVILGHAELLRESARDQGGLPDDIEESLDAIYRNAKAQHQIISDLLDISAIITGKVAFHPNRMDAGETIRNAVESVRFAAEAKGVSLVTDDKGTSMIVMGDATRLQQVVWNLLTNAVKFTPKGGRVTISTRNESSRLVVEVRDTGIGIEPDFLPYVFDRFRQEDSSLTRRFGGLGLGLSIVRQLVELHGGSVEVASGGKGQGSSFTIRLPIAPVDDVVLDQKTPAARAAEGAAPTLNNVDVLVVDDEPDARALLERLLTRAGSRVRSASTVKEAFQKYAERRPEIIVSDIGMPDEDGLTFMRRLRHQEAESGDFTPAIALTAYARDEERRRALAAGYQSHLPKPVEGARLVETILQLIHF